MNKRIFGFWFSLGLSLTLVALLSFEQGLYAGTFSCAFFAVWIAYDLQWEA
ncbi:MAG: hypothetical protein ACK5M8_19025 [Shewanella algae]